MSEGIRVLQRTGRGGAWPSKAPVPAPLRKQTDTLGDTDDIYNFSSPRNLFQMVGNPGDVRDKLGDRVFLFSFVRHPFKRYKTYLYVYFGLIL